MAEPRGRLLVALEPAEDSLALIETATRLAAALERELVGLLVADPGLEAAAALPFTRLQPLRGLGPAPFDRPDLERALRAFLRLAERRLAAACARRSVRWSLTVAADASAVSSLREGDLLVLGPRIPPGGLAGPPTSPIVVLRPGGRSVLLVLAGGDGLLEVARLTAAREGLPLVVVLWGAAASHGLPPELGLRSAEVVRVSASDTIGLRAVLRRHAPAILFLDACAAAPGLSSLLAALHSTADRPTG